MVKEFDKLLNIEGKPPSQKEVYEKRLARIEEAISWSSGSFTNKDYHGIWDNGKYAVKLGKPGKEATRESGYSGKELNLHDMRPDIFIDNRNLDKAATFGNIVSDLEQVARDDRYCVELLAVLFYRSAFLLDHHLVDIQGSKYYRYIPNPKVVEYISEHIQEIYGVPPEVFMQYMDAISLNEDVKYYSKGKDLKKNPVGGKNTLLTFVKVTAVITGDLPLSDIAAPLLMSGVSPINQRQAKTSLPHL